MSFTINRSGRPEIVVAKADLEPFRAAIEEAWGRVIKFAREATIAFRKVAPMMNHRDKAVRVMKVADRRMTLRELRENGRGPGFTGHTTPQAKAMHAAYRRWRR